MERIKNILQKLQEIYFSKHQKSAIDVDLMLDYTRVMYADLLEWRGQFKEPITTETAEKNTHIVTSEAEKQEEQKEQPSYAAPSESSTSVEEAHTNNDNTANQQEEAQPEAEEEIPVPVKETEAAPSPAAAPQNEPGFLPIERDEPPVKEPVEDSDPVVDIYPDKEKVEVLMTDTSGISFEPPAPAERVTELDEELLVEAPTVNRPVEEIAVPAPVEIPLPDMQPLKKQEAAKPLDLFHAAKAANKDIRGSIGINDKYLFLNELFNNHKSNYEETLDKLNHFSTAEQAEDWIRTKVAPVQKWDNDDATVQSFYAMLSKHFSAR